MPGITAVQQECREKRPALRGRILAHLEQRVTAPARPVQLVIFVSLELQHQNRVLLAVGLLLPHLFHKMYVCLVHQHQVVQRAQSPIASKFETTLQCWLLILIVFGVMEVVGFALPQRP